MGRNLTEQINHRHEHFADQKFEVEGVLTNMSQQMSKFVVVTSGWDVVDESADAFKSVEVLFRSWKAHEVVDEVEDAHLRALCFFLAHLRLVWRRHGVESALETKV